MTVKSTSSTVAPRAIVVMGVSGSGKSTLAQLLAAQLQCPFIEADTLHDARCIAKMSRGEALNDDDRWPWLDRVGSAVQRKLDRHEIVVAACSALRYRYRERLRAAITAPVLFVLLDAPLPHLLQRLEQRRGHFMPPGLLPSQLATLERPEEQEAALILDATHTPEQLCRELLALLKLPAHTASDASG